VSAISGDHYYINFVHHYNKYVWLYPLIKKSDAFSIFLEFKIHVKKFLGCSIKALQTDGGGEFIKSKPYLSSQGIGHHLSCLHTSAQNNIAEKKKHRHLVETGLTLLAWSNVLFHYWPYAFQTSSFLISRMPTPFLHNLSPY